MVRVEPRSDFPPQLRLAVPAETLAALARPLDLGEVAVVGFEDIVVLREDRADVGVRAEPPLLLDRSPAASERVHDLPFRLGLRVRREDARLRDRGRHLAPGSEEAREQLVVNERRLRIPEPRSDVPRDPEVRILVDAAWDEDRDRLPFLDGRKERWGCLDARVEDLPDVVGVLESEHGLRRGVRDPLRDLDRDRVEMADVFGVEEDPRELRIEAHRDDVEDVVVPDLRRIFELVEVLEEELLIVRDLEIHGRTELLLKPLREEPWEHVPNVNPAGGTAACVQREAIALLVFVEDPVHIPVAVEHAPAEHRMEFARNLPNPFEKVRRDPLRAELGDEPIVVDGTLHFPRRDHEVLGHQSQPQSPVQFFMKDDTAFLYIEASPEEPEPKGLRVPALVVTFRNEGEEPVDQIVVRLSGRRLELRQLLPGFGRHLYRRYWHIVPA